MSLWYPSLLTYLSWSRKKLSGIYKMRGIFSIARTECVFPGSLTLTSVWIFLLCQQLILSAPNYIYTHTHTSQKRDTLQKNVLKTSNAPSQLITFESFNVNNSMCLFCRFFIKVHRPIFRKKIKKRFEEVITQRLKKYWLRKIFSS